MKICFTIIFVAAFAVIACSQNSSVMSDAQFEGLKGKVKTVKYENTLYGEDGNVFQKRDEVSFVIYYDESGNRIERTGFVNNIPTVKTKYWRNSGEIYSKDTKLSDPETFDEQSPPPAQKTNNEKPEFKDNSFDLKVKVKYDSSGNLVERLVYGNSGRFLHLKLYEYDKDRNKLKETVFTDDGNRYNDSTIYAYDVKAILVQETNLIGGEQEFPARPTHKLSYIYTKFDGKGNWLERRVFDSINNKPVEGESKLVRIEYQTITYY